MPVRLRFPRQLKMDKPRISSETHRGVMGKRVVASYCSSFLKSEMLHIYFGHAGVHLLPFIEQWDKACVVSFHGADVAHKPEIKDYPGKLRRLFDAVPLVFARSQSLIDRLIQLGCPPEKLRINRTGIP